MNAAYKVEYETRWENDFLEDDEKRVTAKDAEAAVVKAKKLVSKETAKDNDTGKVYKRAGFKLQSVNLITVLDG